MIPDDINCQSAFGIAQLLVLLTCVGFQEKWLVKVSKTQHRGLKISFLKCHKCVLDLHYKCYPLTLLTDTFPRYTFVYWLCDTCKPFDELLIVPHQAMKGLDLCTSSGWGKLSHSFQVLFAGPDTLTLRCDEANS